MLWIPGSNDSSNVCLGLEERYAARPPMSEAIAMALIAVNVVFTFLQLASIPVLFWLRNEPRFQRIRPFSLGASMAVIAILYVQGCLVPPLVNGFPCALELLLHLMGYAAGTGVTTARALVFVTESQYAIAATKESAVVRDVSSSMSSASTKDDNDMESFSFVFIIKEITLLGMGLKKVEDVTLITWANLRRRYLHVFLAFLFPPFIFFAIAVLAQPQWRGGCVNCGISLEFFLTSLAYPTYQAIFLVNYLRIGVKYKKDPQEVLREMFFMALTSPPWSYLGYALDVVDPHNVSYNRKFFFQFLFVIGLFFFWYQSTFWQIVKAVRAKWDQNRRMRRLPSSTMTRSFVDACALDKNLKARFYEFVAGRYAAELLKFIDDVQAYKTQFETHNEIWRKKKALELIFTYIRRDAPQQVNISERQRERISRTEIADGSNAPKLLTLFDDAVAEVVLMINTGMWLEFKASQMDHSTHSAAGKGTATVVAAYAQDA